MKDRKMRLLIFNTLSRSPEVAKLYVLKIPVRAFTSETPAEEREEVHLPSLNELYWKFLF